MSNTFERAVFPARCVSSGYRMHWHRVFAPARS